MTDTARYTSLIKRQKLKLAYGRKLVAKFEKCAMELGPNPSANQVAEWLNTKRIKPSAPAKPNPPAKVTNEPPPRWHASTVQDYCYLDGVEPTPELTKPVPNMSKKEMTKLAKDYGPRVVAVIWFDKVKDFLLNELGSERFDFERERLRRHLIESVEVATLLRRALRIPER